MFLKIKFDVWSPLLNSMILFYMNLSKENRHLWFQNELFFDGVLKSLEISFLMYPNYSQHHCSKYQRHCTMEKQVWHCLIDCVLLNKSQQHLPCHIALLVLPSNAALHLVVAQLLGYLQKKRGLFGWFWWLESPKLGSCIWCGPQAASTQQLEGDQVCVEIMCLEEKQEREIEEPDAS